MPDQLQHSLEDNVLTLLVWSEVHASTVAQRAPPDLFSTVAYQRIAEVAHDYLTRYQKPPRVHLRDLLEADLRRGAEGQFLGQILGAMEQLQAELQPDFVMRELDNFIEKRRMSQAVERASDSLHAGDNRTARAALWEALNSAPLSPDLPDPWAELTPPPFDEGLLPRVLKNFVRDRAAAMGVDPTGLAWAALSACSASLDGSIRLEIETGFQVPPGLWVLLVGDSGIGKTPITAAAWRPVEQLQRGEFDTHAAAKAAWEAADKEKRGPEPYPIRYIAKDTTIEALQQILARQNRGVAKLQDEWASFVGQFDKYSASRGASLTDRAFYLQSYDGGPYTVDRVGRGSTYIRNLHLVVFGGVQPDRLRALGNLTDDGLLQRTAPIILRPMTTGSGDAGGRQVAQYEALIEHLACVEGDCAVRLSPEARRVANRVKEQVADWRGNNALGAGFRTFVDKLIGMWGRLTLVLGFVMNESGVPLAEIGREPAEIAEGLVFNNLLVHAARFYEWLGGGGSVEVTQSIAGFLLTKERAHIVPSNLTNNVHPCRGMSLRAIQDAVSPLVAMGWLTPDRDFNPNRWTVAEGIYAQFGERAEMEKYRRAQVRKLIQGRVNTEPDDRTRTPFHEKYGANRSSAFAQTDEDPSFINKYDPAKNVPIAHKHDSHEILTSEDVVLSGENKLRRGFVYRQRSTESMEARLAAYEEYRD